VKLGINRGAKIVIAVSVVVIVGLVVNTLVQSPQSYTGFGGGVSYSPPSIFESPVVYTSVRSTTTLTTTQMIGSSGIFDAPESAPISPSTRMEIFSAQMSVEVADVRSATDRMADIAKQFDGYVAGSSVSVFEDQDSAYVTLRVPRTQFYNAISVIESLGDLKNKATQSDDVTEEYVDLTARRDNLQAQETRLQEILALATSVDDVLNVESELERVRGEIERLTGQINYIENNVALSTITVTFTQPVETPFPKIDWAEPFVVGLNVLYATTRGLVILAFAAIPFVVIGIPLYLVYRRRNRPEHDTIPQKNS
jgi:preprotein translocase subunit SecG